MSVTAVLGRHLVVKCQYCKRTMRIKKARKVIHVVVVVVVNGICVFTTVTPWTAVLHVAAQLCSQWARLRLHGGAADICGRDEQLIIYFYALL